MQTQTIDAANWWARPRGDQAQHWVNNYKNSTGHRHRTLISQIVGEIAPVNVLELGCHCGPNLMRIAADHPGVTCAGLDVNADAIAAGMQWVAQATLRDRIEMAVGRAPQATEKFPDGAFDVVLTCYTLAYIAPADLDATLYEVGRLAKRAVILAEPQQLEGDVPQVRASMSGYTEWQHNYQIAKQWAKTLRHRRARIVPVVPHVDALNAILVLEN